jgi:hypothetical protein
MLKLLTCVLLAQAAPASEPGAEPSLGVLAANFETPVRATFPIWGSHGDLEPSEDGQFIFFSENGPEGLVLKRASLSDGTVAVETTGVVAQRLAIVPGDPDHLVVAWQDGVGAKSPFSVAVLNVKTGVTAPLDVRDGTDGRLYVSPSGRFVATRVFVAHRPSTWPIAIFSLTTGKREVTRRWAGTGPISWTTDDELVFSWGSPMVALRRLSSGTWAESSTTKYSFCQRPVVQEGFYEGEPFRFLNLRDGIAVDVKAESLFGANEPSVRIGYSLPDRAIAVRIRYSRGWQYGHVEAVVLRWKTKK